MMAPGGMPQQMGQGLPGNPGMPGGQPMGVSMNQQMHPGAAGPGGMQVTQGGPMGGGMMPGVPPGVSGGGPNAHALSHLNPHGAAMMAQQQQMQQACKFLLYLTAQSNLPVTLWIHASACA